MRALKLLLAAAVIALSACAGQVPESDTAGLNALLASRTRGAAPATATDDPAAHTINTLLAAPLSRHDAVRIALVNNPRLRRAYAVLGVAAADVFDQSRLSNPSLALGAIDSDASGAVMRISAAMMQNFADALTLSDRTEIASRRAQQIVFEVAADLWNLAQDVNAAHVRAVAAGQRAAVRELAAQATGLSAQLAQRYFDAGNINRLELSLAEAALGQTELDAVMARVDADAALTRLKQLLGLHGNAQIQLPPGLQLPVPAEDELARLHALAVAERLDLKAANAAVTVRESNLAMNRRFRYLGNLKAGVEFERDTDDSLLIGPNLNLELPIFNQGQGRIARAHASLERQRAMVDALGLAVEHSISVAHTQVLGARRRVDIYQNRFVPSRRDIVERTREMQNYMIVSPFESLRAKTAEYDAYAAYVDALRDYWLARTTLTREVGTVLPSEPPGSGDRLDTERLTRPPPDHGRHRPAPFR